MINKTVAFHGHLMSSRYHNIIVLSVAFIIAAIIGSPSLLDTDKERNIRAAIFEGSCGWGYDILVDDSLFIHQESVPAVGGNAGFATRKYAEEAAALVLKKLRKEKMPTLSRSDLATIAPLQQLQYDKNGKNQ